jgi:hypothetical protein
MGFTAKRYVQGRRTSAVDDFGGSDAREQSFVPMEQNSNASPSVR